MLSLVFLTGAYDWLRVRPSLADVRDVAHLRRSARVELLVGVVALAVTAVLVALPTPMGVQATSAGPTR